MSADEPARMHNAAPRTHTEERMAPVHVGSVVLP